MKNITITSDKSLDIENALRKLKIDGDDKNCQLGREAIIDNEKCKIIIRTEKERKTTNFRTKLKIEQLVKRAECKKTDTEASDSNKSDSMNHVEKPKPRLIERGPLRRDTSKPEVLPYTTIYTSRTHQSIGIAMCCPPASNKSTTSTVKLKPGGYNPFANNIVEFPQQSVQEERDALCEAIASYMTAEQMGRVYNAIDNVEDKQHLARVTISLRSHVCICCKKRNRNEADSQTWALLNDSSRMPPLNLPFVQTVIKEISDSNNGYESGDSMLSPESSMSPFSPMSQVVPDLNRGYRFPSDRSTSSGVSGSPTSCLSLSPIPTSTSPFNFPANYPETETNNAITSLSYSLSEPCNSMPCTSYPLPESVHNFSTSEYPISGTSHSLTSSNYSSAGASFNLPSQGYSRIESAVNIITPAGYTVSQGNKTMCHTDYPHTENHVPQPPSPPPLNNKNQNFEKNYFDKNTYNYIPNTSCLPGQQALSTFMSSSIPPSSREYLRSGRQSRVNQHAQLLPRPVIPKAVTTPGVDRLLQKLDDESKDRDWATVYSVPDVETLCKGDDNDGDTYLMIMVCNWKDKHLGMLYALVERLKSVPGALTKRNRIGHSAFFLACMFAFREPVVARYIADTLLKMGEDIHIVDQFGNTLLHSLCMRGDTHVHVLAEILGLKNSKGEPYFNINQQNCEGGTPLHVAVANDGYMGRSTLETIGLLLEQGADASIKRHCDDCTPLLVACKGSCKPIILEMLLSAHNGAVVQGDARLNTPLHVVVQRDLPWERQRQAINLILDFGSQYKLQTRQNRDGKTVIAVTPADKKDKVKQLLRGR